jgi:hypothetical protein
MLQDKQVTGFLVLVLQFPSSFLGATLDRPSSLVQIPKSVLFRSVTDAFRRVSIVVQAKRHTPKQKAPSSPGLVVPARVFPYYDSEDGFN